MKKTMLIFLMLSIILTVLFASPMQILAAEKDETVLVMKGKSQSNDNEIEIEVTVEENTGVCSMLLSLEYDMSVFTLTDLEYGTALSSLSPIHTNTSTEQGYGIYPFKISYLGDNNDTSVGKLMTLRFRVKENAPEGSYHITFKYEKDKDVSYLQDGKILTKNLLIDGAKVTLSSDEAPKIETYPAEEGQPTANKPIVYWLVGIAGAAAAVTVCALIISTVIKHKKHKKWNKIQ